MQLKEQILEAAEFIRNATPHKPELGLILGTGLGSLADEMSGAKVIPYNDIPHFPESTVKFHKGRLLVGKLSGKTVFTMQGRFHYYEGYPMRLITLPVRVMHQLGIRTLIITNAAGGIREHLTPGTITTIVDHLNLMGDNPLIGPYDEFLGERFPDMSEPYSKRLRDITYRVAEKQGIQLTDSVFAAVSGPSYETPAEIRMLQILGADSVGMSVVPEVLVARQLDMDVLGLSVITDQALPDNAPEVSHEEVSKIANQVGPILAKLVKGVIAEL